MSDGKLVELGPGFQVYASSAIEARFIYEEIFQEGGYEDVGLPAQPFVLDVGANIGMFVVYIKTKYPDAEVVAFEPAPASVELLHRNIALHGLNEVVVHQIALGAAAERDVPFTYYPMIPGNSTRYPEIKELQKTNMAKTFAVKVVERMHRGEQLAVAVERLSSYLDPARPVDLLKIDAEGAEGDVLLGIDPEHWPLIRQVVIEVQDLDDRLASVCAVLTNYGLQPAVRPAPLIEAENRAYLVHARRP
jgi:FkbM family methyltransferase